MNGFGNKFYIGKQLKSLVFLILCFSLPTFAQKNDIFNIDSIPADGLQLNKYWKFKTGDNVEWSKPDFDDSDWVSIDPTKEINRLKSIKNSNVKWLRLHIFVKNKQTNPIGLMINQIGASEIYLNGQFIYRFGVLSSDSTKIIAYDPLNHIIHLPIDSIGNYTLAVKYALQPNIRYTNIFSVSKNILFDGTIVNLMPKLNEQREIFAYKIGLDIFILGISFILFLLIFVFYLSQRNDSTKLFLALYLFGTTFIRLFKIIGQTNNSVEYRYYYLNFANCLLGFVIICLAIVVYRISKKRLDNFFNVLVAFQIFYVISSSITQEKNYQTLLLFFGNLYSFFVLIRLLIIGAKKGIKGFYVLSAFILFAIFGLLFISFSVIFLNYSLAPLNINKLNYGISPYLIDIIFTISSISIPVGLSLFMGIEINTTNNELKKQIVENEKLKNDAISYEKEKQQILATQNETLETLVENRTSELNNSIETLKATQNQLIQSEKLANLGELTAGISHEIQNPLNFVNNFSELSIDLVKDLKFEIEKPTIDKSYVDELFEDLIQNQNKINHHGKRASSIVKGMLEHSRTSTGQREWININQLSDEYFRLSYHGLRAKDKSFNANCITRFDDNLPEIKAIQQDLGRVFLNLMNNAFYAVNDKRKQINDPNFQPTVEVSTRFMDNQIEFSIKDNGNGIPESIKSKIFQPFFTTKPSGEGTGLGLSLSYDIITKGHNGTIEIETIENEGTTFIIKLPCS